MNIDNYTIMYLYRRSNVKGIPTLLALVDFDFCSRTGMHGENPAQEIGIAHSMRRQALGVSPIRLET
jgi:hypothetical protein